MFAGFSVPLGERNVSVKGFPEAEAAGVAYDDVKRHVRVR